MKALNFFCFLATSAKCFSLSAPARLDAAADFALLSKFLTSGAGLALSPSDSCLASTTWSFFLVISTFLTSVTLPSSFFSSTVSFLVIGLAEPVSTVFALFTFLLSLVHLLKSTFTSSKTAIDSTMGLPPWRTAVYWLSLTGSWEIRSISFMISKSWSIEYPMLNPLAIFLMLKVYSVGRKINLLNLHQKVHFTL